MAGQMTESDLELDSPMGNNLRNTVLGRKTMARLTAIGRGEADADVRDEGDAVAEDEIPVEGAAPADGAPADGASVDVQDESEVVAEVEISAEDVAPADTSSVTEEAEA